MNKNALRLLFVVIVLVGGGVVYQQTRPETDSVEYTLKKLDEKIILPPNQAPQIARIETPEALAEVQAQPFFQSTQLGDSLVVYPDRVIVYRPSTEKVVTMGVISPEKSAELFNTETSAPVVAGISAVAVAPTATAPVANITVEIRNGTGTAGLAKKYADQVIKNVPGATVPVTGNAANKNYAKTVIVNTKGIAVPQLETDMGGVAVKELPVGEAVSTADIVIILGADKK
jgi:hypothetical protein